jgi:xylulose-5-phosphate/fructose-6-phosphate phosphoketolase
VQLATTIGEEGGHPIAPELRGSPVLSGSELTDIHAWWRPANYLAVGQIYLMGNALLRRDLLAEDVKPRLLGHWGTTLPV